MSLEISKPAAKSAVQDQNATKAKSAKQLAKATVPAAPVVPAEAEIEVKKVAVVIEESEKDDELHEKVANWLNPSEEAAPQTTIVLAQASAASMGSPATATDAGGGASSAAPATATTTAAPAAEQASSSGYSWLLGLGALALAGGGSSADTSAPDAPKINPIGASGVINASAKAAGVTISGTAEAGSTVTVTWGSATATATANTSGVWTTTIASTAVPADGKVNLVVSAKDAAGNKSADTTLLVTIDATAPAKPSIDSVTADGIVSGAEKTAGVAVSGTAESEASVAVTWGSVVKTVKATTAGVWTVTFAAADVPADAASSSISAIATDTAGNASAAGTKSVAIDTSGPAAAVISSVATDDKVNATEKTAGVAVSGTAEAGSSVAITWGATVKTVTAGSDGAWTTIFESANIPADAASTTISTVVTDAAGNVGTASTKTVVVDTAAPTVTVLTASSTDQTITLTYSEALDGTNLPATTAFTVSIGGVANTVSSIAVTGSTMVLKLTNAFSAGAVSVAYADPTTGNDSSAIQDLAGNDSASFANTVVADGYIRGATVYIDVNKNGAIDVGTDYLVGTTDANGNILIPGNAPAGSIIATGGVNTDTGAANTMVLKAPQGATTINPLTTLVQAVIEKAVAANPGTVVDATLIEQASKKVADSLGLTSSLGGASLLNYDPIAKGDTVVQKAAAQVATIVSLAGNAEAGSSVISKLTDVINGQTSSTPAIDLTNAATLTSVLPSTTSDADKAAIAAATTSISTASTLAAITNAQSAAIDKTAPEAPKSVEFAAASKTAQPVIKISFDATKADGTALIAGDTLTIKDGANVLGSAITLTAADLAKGYVEVTAPTLTEGAHSITASFTDKAGNVSTASAAKTLTVDLTAPAKPSITAVADNSGSADDTITNDATPTLTISAEAGSTVEVFSGSTSLGKATETSTAGVFTFTAESLKDGDYSLTATSSDAAGNSSTSNAQALTIDTVKPTTPVIANAVEGASAVTLTIMGAAGSKVDVYSGTTKLGTATESTTTAGQFTYAAALNNSGKYSFSAKASDSAGNESAASAAQSMIFAAGQSFSAVTPGSVELKLISSDATKATFGIYATGTSISITNADLAIPFDSTKVSYTLASSTLWGGLSADNVIGNEIIFGLADLSPITSTTTALATFSLNWVSGPTTINLSVKVDSLGDVDTKSLVNPTYKFVPGGGSAVTGADDVSDLFLIGGGQVTVTGGKGADVFALTSASNNTLTITDFTTGSDSIDVGRFLTATGYTNAKDTGAIEANVALYKSLTAADLALVASNSATLDNVGGYFFEAATSGTNKGTLHLVLDKDAATGTGHVNLVQLDIVLGATSTGFSAADLMATLASKPVI